VRAIDVHVAAARDTVDDAPRPRRAGARLTHAGRARLAGAARVSAHAAVHRVRANIHAHRHRRPRRAVTLTERAAAGRARSVGAALTGHAAIATRAAVLGVRHRIDAAAATVLLGRGARHRGLARASDAALARGARLIARSTVRAVGRDVDARARAALFTRRALAARVRRRRVDRSTVFDARVHRPDRNSGARRPARDGSARAEGELEDKHRPGFSQLHSC
jgi:hypothetical protein